jgi:hypothetical protein
VRQLPRPPTKTKAVLGPKRVTGPRLSRLGFSLIGRQMRSPGRRVEVPAGRSLLRNAGHGARVNSRPSLGSASMKNPGQVDLTGARSIFIRGKVWDPLPRIFKGRVLATVKSQNHLGTRAAPSPACSLQPKCTFLHWRGGQLSRFK